MKTILDGERRGSERDLLKNQHFHGGLQNEKQVAVQKPKEKTFQGKGKESAKALW